MFGSLRLKFIAGLGGFAVMVAAILVVTGVIRPFQDEGPSGKITLWSFPQYEEVLRAAADGYRRQFPGVAITLETRAEESYEMDLLEALATGASPDIFMVEAGDLPRFLNKIRAFPADHPFSLSLESTAADVIGDDLTASTTEVIGVPLFLDTLALYYNRDHLNAANIPEPPKTWEDFRAYSAALFQRSPTGAVARAGAAMGTASNVNHAADIFSIFVLQSGNPIVDRKTGEVTLAQSDYPAARVETPAVSALEFYKSFADTKAPNYTWNASMPGSREAFAAGRASFYIGYAGDMQPIVRASPHLNFRVAELPQLVKGERRSMASYPVLVVSRLSKDPVVSWAFTSALFEKNMHKFIVDTLGTAPARRDLAASRPPNPALQPFYNQILSAQSWPKPGREKVEAVFGNMIEMAVRGQLSSGEAISRASAQLSLLLK